MRGVLEIRLRVFENCVLRTTFWKQERENESKLEETA
jgi:hypothetical protein